MLHHTSFCFGAFQENTYVLWDDDSRAVVVDPGCYEPEEQALLQAFIREENLRPQAVWLTHCHIDHVAGLDFVIRTWNLPYFLSRGEVPQLRAVEWYAPNYGFYGYQKPDRDGTLFDSPVLKLGGEEFQVLSVPGHSPDHVAFYHPSSGQIWAGDVLFRGSIGRTDLPGGDFAQLETSIRTHLYTLPAETKVFPGHGPETKIGFEKLHNPFVRATQPT